MLICVWRSFARGIEQGVQRRVNASHGSIRLDDHVLDFPLFPQVGSYRGRIRIVSCAEGRQEAAVFVLEHAFDPRVSSRCERGGIKSVTRSEAMMHSLAVGLVLRCHKPAGLRCNQPERIFESPVSQWKF